MRLLNVYHHAHGDDFARLCPDLAGWPLPVLRIAVRAARADCDPPRTPVIAHSDHDTAHPAGMVWTLDPAVPTLVRPRRWLDSGGSQVELVTDAGPYLVAVLSVAQVAAVCRRLWPPADPADPAPASETARPTDRRGPTDRVDALREARIPSGGVPTPTDPAEIAGRLAAATLAAQRLTELLAGLLDATATLDERDYTCTPLPDVADWYGGGVAGACAAAGDALHRTIADLGLAADRLSTAHLHLDRLHPTGRITGHPDRHADLGGPA